MEIGTRFRSSVDGYVTGIRFYKGPLNTGTHTGRLWTNAGVLLATVTFTNETASGWQQANLSSPVAITANTTYVVTYHAPNGHYTGTDFFFASSALVRGPLQALRDGAAIQPKEREGLATGASGDAGMSAGGEPRR